MESLTKFELCEMIMNEQKESMPFTSFQHTQVRHTYQQVLTQMFNECPKNKPERAKAIIDKAVRYDLPMSYVLHLRMKFQNFFSHAG